MLISQSTINNDVFCQQTSLLKYLIKSSVTSALVIVSVPINVLTFDGKV